jgi:hypothetical protein
MWRRVHLFELIDQSWIPAFLRDAETDYLATVIAKARPFHPLAKQIAPLLDAHDDRIVDLASGGAGPWPSLRDAIASERSGRAPSVTLTDLYPNTRAFARAAADGIAHEATPVDATAVPARLRGVRTMFDGLHHLRPEAARAVLVDAHRARVPIVIGEALGRRPSTLIGVLLIPLFVLLLTPLVRPFSIARLVFTYLVPILPLVIAWDGFVSCLRTYRPHELLALTEGLDGYRWTAGDISHRGGTLTYLVGEPM